jgi:hypothetical protein
MSRPLIQRGIGELEAMFNVEHGDPKVLAALETELAFRSVPRAVRLLAKVRRALAGEMALPTPTQKLLFEPHSPPLIHAPGLVITPTMPPVQNQTALPALSLKEAYRALRLTPSASWEAIEASRRELVNRARPDKIAALKDTQRESVKREAQVANAACMILAKFRGSPL